ncbi:MAG: LuxR C-terminal-related transcriptional regulator [Treponema sp.]|jgi:LuxR family maltose regulon positive regulatory protein|nr:LuxR C-terminal-related transcriptional regulator [Treponema sp.]
MQDSYQAAKKRRSPASKQLPAAAPRLHNQILLERPRLDRLLEEALESPLLVVCAGAGCGKTQALYSFLERSPRDAVWIPLNEQDNYTDRFWEDFTAAFQRNSAFSSAGAMMFPGTERQYRRFIRFFLEAVKSDKKPLLVFDDFQELKNREALGFVERMISSLPPNAGLVLISRSKIPLALDQTRHVLLSEEDLRFNREEMDAYFALENIHVTGETAEQIYEDSEGWAFALHLAALAIKNSPSALEYTPHVMRANIFRLIESEIILVISKDLRRLLIRLSLLERHPAQIVSELGGAELLAELSKLDSFVRLDSFSENYHFHNLLMEYMRSFQGELDEGEKRGVYLKMARWQELHNKKIAAIFYYEKAGAYEAIFHVALSGFSFIMSEAAARQFLQILERIGPAEYEEHHHFHVLRAWINICLSRFDEVETLRSNPIPALKAMPPDRGVNWTLALCYFCLGTVGRLRCRETKDYSYVDDYEQCALYWAGADVILGKPLSMASVGPYICRVLSPERGEIEKYIKSLSRMLELLQDYMGGYGCGVDDLAWGELFFFRGELKEAERRLKNALEKAREKDQYEVETVSIHYLVRIFVSRGDLTAVRTYSEMFRRLHREADYVNRFTYYDIGAGWFYTLTGRIEKMADWLKNDFEASDLNSLIFGQELIVKARYHFVMGEYPAAIALTRSGGAYGPESCLMGIIIMKLLEAASRFRMGDREEAFDVLEETWIMAAPNGFIMPYIEMGKEMRSLAAAYAESGRNAIPRETVEKFRLLSSAYSKRLAAVSTAYRPAEQRDPLVEDLSRRELNVLVSLSQGLTGDEIAVDSDLSVNTVKSVIKHIYEKLGAVNRADAVRIATARGLLVK